MLDVRGSRELQATILALRRAQRDIRLDINKTARSRISPLWKRELNARARTPMEIKVLTTGARATASDRGVTVYAATKNRPLSGGLVPSKWYAPVEFGADRKQVTVRQRSRGGKVYSRPMQVNRGFKPRRRYGMVAMDAASKTGTKLVALWVRTVVDELAQVDGMEVT